MTRPSGGGNDAATMVKFNRKDAADAVTREAGENFSLPVPEALSGTCEGNTLRQA